MRRVSILLAIAVIVAPLASATAAPNSAKRLPALSLVADDALQNALEKGRLSTAEYALERARSLFQLGKVRAEFGAVARPHPRAATLLLRDLAARINQLEGDERSTAEAILARPDDGGAQPIGQGYSSSAALADPECTPDVCIHYVTNTIDAPASTDASPANSVPDWIDLTLSTMTEVWTAEVDQMGWRAPRPDSTSSNGGGGPQLDVYISDLGQFGAYGYCTTDDPKSRTAPSTYDVSAYCVFDNNYAEAVFGGQGANALRVTAAHEFNHASQYAYDFLEDPWLLESTATWIEDEVYDTINDNIQYLQASPIADPHLPLDTFFEFDYTGDNATFAYGTWVFMRFLSETYDPGIMVDIFERVDGAAGGPDDVSIRAVANVMMARGTTLAEIYRDFAAQNVDPASFYEEGSTYPDAPRAATHALATGTPSAVQTVTLDHLSSQYVTFRPGTGVAPDESLSVAINGPDDATSPLATLVSVSPTGTLSFTEMTLDAEGRGQATIPNFAGMREVVLVLGNGSSRFDQATCYTSRTPHSCGGAVFRDENLRFAYSGTLGDTPVDPGEPGDPPGDTVAPHITNVSDRPDPFRVNGRRLWRLFFTIDEPGFVSIQLKNPAGRRILRVGQAFTDPVTDVVFQW
ncbi:MAG: MXAN_6640 family putative metalloprotease, partial [Actinomycetota bacterium]